MSARRGTPDYEPRHDPRLPADVLNDLLHHPGEWRNPGASLLPPNPDPAQRIKVRDAVRDAVEMGRHIGLVIEGQRRPCGGYRFVRFERVAYVRAAKVEAWPPAETRAR